MASCVFCVDPGPFLAVVAGVGIYANMTGPVQKASLSLSRLMDGERYSFTSECPTIVGTIMSNDDCDGYV